MVTGSYQVHVLIKKYLTDFGCSHGLLKRFKVPILLSSQLVKIEFPRKTLGTFRSHLVNLHFLVLILLSFHWQSKNRTRDSWVGTAIASSELCRHPMHNPIKFYFKKFLGRSYYFLLLTWDQENYHSTEIFKAVVYLRLKVV